jgi:hypothetical protein
MGITFSIPGNEHSIIRKETRDYARCISSDLGPGLVAPPLLGSFEQRDLIFTDRFPNRREDWERLNFVLIAPELPRFELNEDGLSAVLQRIQQEGRKEGRKEVERVGSELSARSQRGNE